MSSSPGPGDGIGMISRLRVGVEEAWERVARRARIVEGTGSMTGQAERKDGKTQGRGERRNPIDVEQLILTYVSC